MATYRDAGVDLEAADKTVAALRPAVTATWGPDVVGGFGGFAAGVELPAGYAHPVLMMSTDGVGTKAEIARRADQVDGLGWDLVAMCADDLVAAGARPVAMTDYLAVGSLAGDVAIRIVSSIAAACEATGLALVGGETAEHPGVMAPDAFDVAGCALGVVERDRAIDGSAIEPGDTVIGLLSPNLRSNGFSLVRHVLLDRLEVHDLWPGRDTTVADVLLEPSIVYTPAVLRVIDQVPVTGLAHVTGGGLAANVSRVLPEHADAIIDTSSWPTPDVFGDIAGIGGVAEPEMRRTFNMGVGFIIVVPQEAAGDTLVVLADEDRAAVVIGEVAPGSGRVRLT